MIRKIIVCLKYLGRRRTACLLPFLVWCTLVLVTVYWLGELTTRALLPPPPPDQNLDHFRRSRDLKHYLDNIQLLVEPSSVPCEDHQVMVVVSSAPSHVEQRDVIRGTWGKHLPTYFLLGLEGTHGDDTLVDNYVEAKLHSDLIVYDMSDHYQNLTLKTMLMLQWTLDRCPRVLYLFKTDDDVLVNPWTLKTVVEENPGAKLLGYRVVDASLHRDEYSKWFVPRWLVPRERVPRYLSGTGYLVHGNYLQEILTAATKVPLINLEDIYLTYLVSNSTLNLELTHDKRLSPYKPWLPLDCAYWALASSHSLSPTEMAHAWAKIERTAEVYKKDSGVCRFFKNFIDSESFLF